jgi:salicylate hydroxylase
VVGSGQDDQPDFPQECNDATLAARPDHRAPRKRATASTKPPLRMTDCHVIIIGAGIGGLAAAPALQRHGLRVSVYEQAPELREFGAGLIVTPNAMHALDFLGVGEAIAAASNVSAEVLIKHYRTAEVLQHRPHGNAYRLKYGAGCFQVHRADLHNALSAAVLANDPGCIRLAHTFNNLEQDHTGVVAHFTNGTVATADALIGCDGGRSLVREMVHGSAPVTYTGQVAFRALVPAASLPQELRTPSQSLFIGPGCMFLHYHTPVPTPHGRKGDRSAAQISNASMALANCCNSYVLCRSR